jgi:protein involved in polysaccharide export with SLBB domain
MNPHFTSCPRSIRQIATALTIRSAFIIAVVAILTSYVMPQSATGSSSEAELIHYGDLVDVDVVGSLEYDWRGFINPEGFLDGFTPGNEPVYALCRTESSIAGEITDKYSKILRDPKVIVKVIDRSGRALTLLMGAVRNQQRLRLIRQPRLSEILALSGGITDLASGEITIFRPADLNCFSPATNASKNNPTLLRSSISQLLQGEKSADHTILSGDIVTVVEASPIYVIGGVNAPKQLSSKEELTVTRAIAGAGGLAKDANERDIVVYRRDGKNSKTINLDLKKIAGKQSDDIALKPFDILEVGRSGRSRSKLPPTVDVDRQSRDIYKAPVRIVE